MANAARVVLIRGVMGRSGTNYLRDLLLVHPECEAAREPIYEDFFLDDASRLEGYVNAVSRRWKSSWCIDTEAVHDELLRRFGDALADFLVGGSSAPVVIAKSPSAAGLAYLDRLFPQVPAILLVRDGRAVIQSAMRSFGWSFERAAHSWLDGARKILSFHGAHHDVHGTRYRLVRYEDVVADPVGHLRDLCSFIGLDGSAVDADLVARLPVRGSSTFGTRSEDSDRQMHWRPVPKDETFVPQRPGADLSDVQLRRFERLAGRELRAFGYPSDSVEGGPVEKLVDPARSVGWWLSDRGRVAKRSTRRRLLPYLRERSWGELVNGSRRQGAGREAPDR